MSSPVIVSTDPTLLIGKNAKRAKVILQNTGDEPVYVKKWPYTASVAEMPSPTNYDFILEAKPGEGNKEDNILQIESVSAFVGITATKQATVAVLETVKVVL